MDKENKNQSITKEKAGEIPEVNEIKPEPEVGEAPSQPTPPKRDPILLEKQKKIALEQHMRDEDRKKIDDIMLQIPDILKKYEYTYAIDEALNFIRLAMNKTHVAVLQSPIAKEKPKPEIKPEDQGKTTQFPGPNRAERRRRKKMEKK